MPQYEVLASLGEVAVAVAVAVADADVDRTSRPRSGSPTAVSTR
jgi:hypothetical protein